MKKYESAMNIRAKFFKKGISETPNHYKGSIHIGNFSYAVG